MNSVNLLEDAASATPDPERALRNLERLLDVNPAFIERHAHSLDKIALLFAHSQFLADYGIRNPNQLTDALNALATPVRKQRMLAECEDIAVSVQEETQTERFRACAMKALRDLKKQWILRITLRDVCGMSGLEESMVELSTLAESIIECALRLASVLMRRKYGLLRQNDFSVIGLGKLGSGELNYSSDIDIMTVYQKAQGTSTGILNPFGIRINTVSAHEYCCALTEHLCGLMRTATEDGIAYRVDTRLRPHGQKGPLSLDLDSSRAYYEAWGKTWERIALIRAKPIAGDEQLGRSFIAAIAPFVWKRSLAYDDIEEIRSMKKKIDTLSDVNDIKHGYGGIREIEFFVHTFQLLFGGENEKLRKGPLLAITRLLWTEGILSETDVETLTAGYYTLRRIEHYLQMKDDLQTYTLPSDTHELEILARKMRHTNREEFLTNLKVMRFKARDMYNTLLGETESMGENLLALVDALPDHAVVEYLSFKGFGDPHAALKQVRTFKEQISTQKTLQERTLLMKTIPAFLAEITRTPRKDRGLTQLVTFFEKIGHHASYLDALRARPDIIKALTRIFSMSTYFSRQLLGLDHLDEIFGHPEMTAEPRALRERLRARVTLNREPRTAVRIFKKTEELLNGMLFLSGALDIRTFLHRLSVLADAIIREVFALLRSEDRIGIIGLGGYGGRELNIGSDLDLLFVAADRESERGSGETPAEKIAEDMIAFLSEYTEHGVAYKVDMRLRPDGSRGILTHTVEGYRTYYFTAAHPWEIQSLLRARPICGHASLLRSFLALRRESIIRRGGEMKGSAVREMRQRIVSEVSKDASGYDLKNGTGGIKEIEFLVQYLQMKHAASVPHLIVHDVEAALHRLAQYGILDGETARTLFESRRFLATVDTLVRCNEEDVLLPDSDSVSVASGFLGMKSNDLLVERIAETRQKVLEIAQQCYDRG